MLTEITATFGVGYDMFAVRVKRLLQDVGCHVKRTHVPAIIITAFERVYGPTQLDIASYLHTEDQLKGLLRHLMNCEQARGNDGIEGIKRRADEKEAYNARRN